MYTKFKLGEDCSLLWIFPPALQQSQQRTANSWLPGLCLPLHRNSQNSLLATLARVSYFIAVFLWQKKRSWKREGFAKNISFCSSRSTCCCKWYRIILVLVGLPRPLPAPIFIWAAGDWEQHLQVKHAGDTAGSMAGEREPESWRKPLEYA